MASKRIVFENSFIRVEALEEGGRELLTIDRQKTQSGAIVVPVMEDGRIALIEEYRHGAGESVVGVVKGACDHIEELAIDVAARELREELGIEASDLVETSINIYALPALSKTNGTVVFAYGCRITTEQDLEPDETIRLHSLVTKDELLTMLMEGGINDAESAVALQAFLLLPREG